LPPIKPSRSWWDITRLEEVVQRTFMVIELDLNMLEFKQTDDTGLCLQAGIIFDSMRDD
jgi:hypothetical protein